MHNIYMFSGFDTEDGRRDGAEGGEVKERVKTLTHEPEHEHGLGTRAPFCLFSEGKQKHTERKK